MSNKFMSECCYQYCEQDAKICPLCEVECNVVNEANYIEALVEEEDDDELCYKCSGSGEGNYDGSICTNCKGKGVEIKIIERDAD